VDAAVASYGSDHSLRATTESARSNDAEREALAASLAHFGGYTDREAVARVQPDEIFE
jgi:hypothetical protein